MFKKLFSILSLSFLSFLFFVPPISAAKQTPATNPVCWTKEDCQAIFQKNGWSWSEKNFFQGGHDDICGSKFGFCIPVGQTDTEISIGGKTQFKDLGDYFKTIYIWALSIGGVVALALVIVGGFMYMTSAGSPDRVKNAKQRISHALLGLFFLLISYTLLYTINPDLVRLQLPKTYMIRQVSLGTNLCKDLPESTKVAPVSGRSSSVEVPKAGFNIPVNQQFANRNELDKKINASQAVSCGFKFFWPDSNDQFCWGHLCSNVTASGKSGAPRTCVNSGTPDSPKYECVEGVLSGTITAEGIDYPFIDDEIRLIAFCTDDIFKRTLVYGETTAENEIEGKSQTYLFNLASMIGGKNPSCPPEKQKFYLLVEVNEKGGIDDWQPVGIENGKCNVNLWKKAGLQPQVFNSLSQKTIIEKYSVMESNFITRNDLTMGLVCNINLKLVDFPPLTGIWN